MKPFSTGILILLILATTFRDNLTYVLFKINQVYIIENFCVNKDKLEMTCNGSCHLSEMLVENQEPEKTDNPMPVPTEEKPTLLCSDLTVIIEKADQPENKSGLAIDHQLDLPGHESGIFRPPQMLHLL